MDEKIKPGGSKYYYDEKGNIIKIIRTRTLKMMNLPRKEKVVFKYEYF